MVAPADGYGFAQGYTWATGNPADSAREIAGMLVEVIEKHPATPTTRLIRPSLVTRASHGPVPVSLRKI